MAANLGYDLRPDYSGVGIGRKVSGGGGAKSKRTDSERDQRDVEIAMLFKLFIFYISGSFAPSEKLVDEILAAGGGVCQSVGDDRRSRSPYKKLLISEKAPDPAEDMDMEFYCTLAAGMPRVKPEWVRKCTEQVKTKKNQVISSNWRSNLKVFILIS